MRNLLFSHTLRNSQSSFTLNGLAILITMEFQWKCSICCSTNISQGQRGTDESLMLKTAVRPQEFVLLFVYALLIIDGI